MRRILTLSFALCAILCLFVFSSSAYQYDDFTAGTLYNKVLYWGDYVTESVPGEESSTNMPGWVTSISLPSDSYWSVRHFSNPDYNWQYASNNFSLSLPNLPNGTYYVDWMTQYYVSIEDIRGGDDQLLRVVLEASEYVSFYNIQVIYFDTFLNHVGTDIVTFSDNNQSWFAAEAEFYIPKSFLDKGAKYIKFACSMNVGSYAAADFEFTKFDWKISLPYEFDPAVFKYDGIQAWMNSYYAPIEPDADNWWQADDEIVDFIEDAKTQFDELSDAITAGFSTYNVAFFVWRQLFNSLIAESHLNILLVYSAFFGLFGFLLGQYKDMQERRQRSTRKQKERMRSNPPPD